MQAQFHIFTTQKKVDSWCQFIKDNWEWTRGIAVKSELDGGKESRTLAQNAALHVWAKQWSESLNENGLDQVIVLSKAKPTSILWTPDKWKEAIFKGVAWELFKVTSTTQLSVDQFMEVVEVVQKYFSQNFHQYSHVLPLEFSNKEMLR